jgi:uncharacterized protein (DUF2236 family)
MFADGYFPRETSILRQVHEERMVGLFYGQRALCIGAMSPLPYVGTSEHSGGKLSPFKRLTHTALAFESVFFGSRAEADKTLAYVHKMHSRVHGTLPQDAGATPKGTAYSAFNAPEMLWTVAVIADSSKYFYELFVRRMSGSEREALWQDYRRFSELFGLARQDSPASYDEFRHWWRTELASERMYLTDEARYVGYATCFEIPFSPAGQFAKPLHNAIQLGALPRRARELYGLRYGRRDHVRFLAGVAAVRSARKAMPARIARGSCKRDYELVRETERRRIAAGIPTPQIKPGQFTDMLRDASDQRAA